MVHSRVPDRETEARDQREFDEAVSRKGKLVLEVLAGVGIVAALLMSIVALNQSSERHEPSAMVQPTVKHAAAATAMAAGMRMAANTPAAASTAVKVIDLKVIANAKPGPDGKKHDAFTKTDFAVKVGQPVTLRIDNKDTMSHSITAPAAGVNITVTQGIHTYKLVVSKAGKFQWYCMLPCDEDANGWAMQNPGFMSGYITAS
jgi:plastocyanin